MSPPALPQPTKQELVKLFRQAVIRGVELDAVEKTVEEQLLSLSTVVRYEGAELVRDEKRANTLPAVIRVGALLVPVLCILLGSYLWGRPRYR